MLHEINPFVIGKYISDDYFCDREKETDFIRKQILNGRNVALIAPRRMGKSDLIKHVFAQPDIQQQYNTFLVDIYATNTLADFVYQLGKAVVAELKPDYQQVIDNFMRIVSSLRPGLKYNPMTNETTFDIGLGQVQTPLTTLEEIFHYLEQSDKPCVVAIDEFQKIMDYQEKDVDALLRTYIQKCKRTRFIYCGSKRHMMSMIFLSPNKPFYESAITSGLEAIPMDVYTSFACKMFLTYGKKVDPQVVQAIYERYEGTTWYVQMVMNELFAITPKGAECVMEMIPIALDNVIAQQSCNYREILSMMATKKKMALLAIAKEGKAKNVTSAAFIKKYGLVSASSVQSAIIALLQDDFITQTDGVYRVYDYFFAEWLAQQ